MDTFWIHYAPLDQFDSPVQPFSSVLRYALPSEKCLATSFIRLCRTFGCLGIFSFLLKVFLTFKVCCFYMFGKVTHVAHYHTMFSAILCLRCRFHVLSVLTVKRHVWHNSRTEDVWNLYNQPHLVHNIIIFFSLKISVRFKISVKKKKKVEMNSRLSFLSSDLVMHCNSQAQSKVGEKTALDVPRST